MKGQWQSQQLDSHQWITYVSVRPGNMRIAEEQVNSLMSRWGLGNMWQKATKRDYSYKKYETPDEREIVLEQLGSLASQDFVPGVWTSYQQGRRNEIWGDYRNLHLVLFLLSLKPATTITRLFKPAISRQVKQKETQPEDLRVAESWYNKITGIVT